MKKYATLVLVMLLSLFMFACKGGGGSDSDYSNTKEYKVESATQAYVISYISVHYGSSVVGAPQITYILQEHSENNFEVTGKVTVKDKYGDSYTGTYQAIVLYLPDEDKATVYTCTVNTLYKN